MDNLNKLLLEFESTLKKKNIIALEKMQPGLTNEQVNQLLLSIGITNEELPILYGWKNGVDYDSGWGAGEIDMFSYGVMIALDDVLTHYDALIKQGCIDEHMLPLFTTGAGDYVLYQASKNNIEFGKLFVFAPSITLSEKPESIYDSLDAFFKTINKCYELDAYVFNEGTIEIKYDKETKISKKLNPNAQYWNNTSL